MLPPAPVIFFEKSSATKFAERLGDSHPNQLLVHRTSPWMPLFSDHAYPSKKKSRDKKSGKKGHFEFLRLTFK